MTSGEALARTAERLHAAGIDTPHLDAALLLAETLGITRSRLPLAYAEPLSCEARQRFAALTERRLSGEPVAYILGRREFYGLDFAVSPAALIPRPDTETLVEAALDQLDKNTDTGGGRHRCRGLPLRPSPPPAVSAYPLCGGAAPATPPLGGSMPPNPPSRGGIPPRAPRSASRSSLQRGESPKLKTAERFSAATPLLGGTMPPALVLDLCTGSGAVAVSLKHERPDLAVYASDLSPEALALARINAERLLPALPGTPPLCFIESDLFSSFAEAPAFGLIVSNPPYVASALLPLLAPEVLREPRLALDGGEDGLTLIRRIIAEAPDHLLPGGALLLEADPGQMGRIAALLAERGFGEIQTRRDLAGRERVIAGRIP